MLKTLGGSVKVASQHEDQDQCCRLEVKPSKPQMILKPKAGRLR
jgi:hypothetical protein